MHGNMTAWALPLPEITTRKKNCLGLWGGYAPNSLKSCVSKFKGEKEVTVLKKGEKVVMKAIY